MDAIERIQAGHYIEKGSELTWTERQDVLIGSNDTQQLEKYLHDGRRASKVQRKSSRRVHRGTIVTSYQGGP
jgi:hypothetical protein